MTTATTQLTVIRTAQDVEQLKVPHADIVDGELCGIPCNKRAALLTKEEYETLNAWTVKNVRCVLLEVNHETVEAIMGLEEVDPKKTPAWLKVGDKHYASTSNKTNRKLVEARLGSDTQPGYTYDMVHGYWGMADAGVIVADGSIGSLQHRGAGFLRGETYNPNIGPFFIPLLLNIPPQFVDLIDRGKERSAKEREYRDDSNFTDELLESVLAELPVPTDLPNLRNQWSDTLVTVGNNIYCRCNGIDWHPPKRSLPTDRERLLVAERFNPSQDLQKLILEVWQASLTPDGKKANWTKTFSNAMVVTAIVLWQNSHHEDKEHLELNWSRIQDFLGALTGSSGENASGPLGNGLADIQKVSADLKKKTGRGSLPPSEVFGSLVTLIGQWDESGLTDKVWLGTTDRKKAKLNKAYRCFGGVDTGYIGKDE